MKTFSITTLGCRVNHYEGEQLATLLRGRGLMPAPPERADLRIVHTCSVTVQGAGKSRQAVRRATRLTVLDAAPPLSSSDRSEGCVGVTNPVDAIRAVADSTALNSSVSDQSSVQIDSSDAGRRPRVIVTGCWATSDPEEAAALRGVDAVLGHHQDVGRELTRLLTQWDAEEGASASATSRSPGHIGSTLPEPEIDDKWMMKQAGTPAGSITPANGPHAAQEVNGKLESDENPREGWNEVRAARPRGMTTLPMLGQRQGAHQRAFLKVQDGCDAHCTYCIIHQLRPGVWSKPVDDAVDEARRLVTAGHVEIVLTGIFLGAYGQPTALRRRQTASAKLGDLVTALCTRVPGLRRLRMSSLEPGDLTSELIRTLRPFPQVVPHFHLPLQSGSDAILRRMNRQYGREDFLRMVGGVHAAFDRPAITTDVIVGFPGETADEFERTVEVVERVGFIHVHAFPYSPRPKTAAARWTRAYVRGPIVNERIARLGALSAAASLALRRRFLGQTVRVLVEQGGDHGRCERYFNVRFDGPTLAPGTEAEVRVDAVTADDTFGTVVGVVR